MVQVHRVMVWLRLNPVMAKPEETKTVELDVKVADFAYMMTGKRLEHLGRRLYVSTVKLRRPYFSKAEDRC
ncbi:hypothetical protein J7E50_08875 [Pedobacter sp. ISL-68]|uniref:hypothetical protein n=1 Tax=unclassified Pedobacter TaxID=2628915 RepID=UPI001BEA382C|nr:MULTISPECIES: hypothetical protein [unclassified Pedobacter]MBT2560938.1 hypothetical protein [Pedobacter sp. ISL-64]MBT2590328.1 hypothetical protein [Pedobacter sp. ISL-68]